MGDSCGRLKALLTLIAILTCTIPPALIITGGVASARVPHDNIVIFSDGDFTADNGVIAGSGTKADPYIIEGWELQFDVGDGITIRNTDAHFVIRDVHAHSSNAGISFYNVTNGRVEGCLLENSSFGIYVRDSKDCRITNNTFSNNYYGIFCWNCASVKTDRNVFIDNEEDVYVPTKSEPWERTWIGTVVVITTFVALVAVLSALLWFRAKYRFDGGERF